MSDAGRPHRQTVLVVDDKPENVEILSEILRPRYRVKVAIDGPGALRIARGAEPPDLILLDVMMPGMDGFEVCRLLKAEAATAEIPVMLVTALSEAVDEAKGLASGAADYIRKPVTPAVVLARVATHIALADHRRNLERLVRERTAELTDTRVEIIRTLGRAAEYRDNETGQHVVRVSHYSGALARAVGLSADHAELVANATPMHDVGKIGIPDRVLLKPGQLEPEERALMERHCEMGCLILGSSDAALLRLARAVALTHHERWDGSGYPRRLAGEQIPTEGGIVAVVDVFDALTSRRPYKAPWPVDEALRTIESGAGTQFQREVVEAFLGIQPEILRIRAEYPDRD